MRRGDLLFDDEDDDEDDNDDDDDNDNEIDNLLSDNAKHCAKHPSVGFSASPVTRQLPLNLKPVRDKVKEVVKI